MSRSLVSPWTPSADEWRELLGDQPRYRLDQLWHGLYQQGQAPAEITTLPAALRQRLTETATPALSPAARQATTDGDTVKWLFAMSDGAAVETVLMHYRHRSTVCVSSQAGCAMGCGFCATGQGGYERNLSVGEILEQVVAARTEAARGPGASDDEADGARGGGGSGAESGSGGRRLSNVVFMGMGEPFANYERVLIATRRIIDDLGIGARHITISTIGLVPQILRFAQEGLQVGLAVSLHAANDEKRSELVPINRRHPLDDLIPACQLFREQTGRRVTFEWAMIDGVNDGPDDAAELATVARAASAHVNLIPLNPTPGWPTVGSPADRVRRFHQRLTDQGITATIRANRGTDIDAACGQLRAAERSTPVELAPPATPG